MRKTLAILVVALTLTGCAVPKFDSLEYYQYVDLTTWTQRARQWCGEPLMMITISDELVHRVKNLDTYATYRPNHKELKEITSLVRANFEELHKAYTQSGQTPSQAYCIGKLTIAESSLKRALPLMGGLPE